MNLILLGDYGFSIMDFIYDIIIPEIQVVMEETILDRKLKKFDQYLNSSKSKYYASTANKSHISSKEILIGSTYNLICKKIGDNYKIEIDKNAKIPDTDETYYNICALINYGALGLQKYSIYEEVYQYILEDYDYLFNKYFG